MIKLLAILSLVLIVGGAQDQFEDDWEDEVGYDEVESNGQETDEQVIEEVVVDQEAESEHFEFEQDNTIFDIEGGLFVSASPSLAFFFVRTSNLSTSERSPTSLTQWHSMAKTGSFTFKRKCGKVSRKSHCHASTLTS